jgi:hypothetical protein
MIYLFLILQLNNRLNASKEEKRKRINYIGIGVTDDAQKVFNAIHLKPLFFLCLIAKLFLEFRLLTFSALSIFFYFERT